jgi:hypothetical protein
MLDLRKQVPQLFDMLLSSQVMQDNKQWRREFEEWEEK